MATTSNLTGNKEIIGYAHDVLFNKRALSVKDFEDLGSTTQAHAQWVEWVDELKKAVDAYNDVTQAKDAVKAFKAACPDFEGEVDEQKALDIITGRVFSAWRSVMKAGTEKAFNKNFFIRETDVVMLAGFCGLGTTQTARGPQLTHKSAADFRKRVEMCIGIRMTGNGMLSDETRDLIVAYENAVRTIDRNKALLADSKDTNGKTIAGLETELKLQAAKLDEQNKMLDELGIEDEKKAAILSGLQAKVDELTEKISDAKEAIADAEKIKNDNQKKYDKAIALLKSVGDYQ